ncbi:hypothetical protein PREVCOP_03711 [Segatella copri DSM 18205]|uniref:Uncharacterized protein n=1 Tax=Segatella copri DSM 18205 TaxID=537011 RepID=D1P954_9BACT|nr:hypothetical protein PREVCOP_03711 [Segatella copri DSM 18205]
MHFHSKGAGSSSATSSTYFLKKNTVDVHSTWLYVITPAI